MLNIKLFSPVRMTRFLLSEPENHYINIWAPEEIHQGEPSELLYHSNWERIDIRQTEGGLQSVSEIPGKIRAEVRLSATESRIEIRHRITNLTAEAWENVKSEVCVQLAEAPQFRYRSGLEVFYSGRDAFHSFKENYVEEKRWFCLFLEADPRKQIAHPLIMVPSKDSEYVIGHAFPSALELEGNGNHNMHCIHSSPRFGRIDPGGTKTETGVVFCVKGDLQNALDYYLELKDALAA